MKYIAIPMMVVAFVFIASASTAEANYAQSGYGTYPMYQPYYQYQRQTVAQPQTYYYAGNREELIAYLHQLIRQLQARVEDQNRNRIHYGTYPVDYGDRELRVVDTRRGSGSSDDEPDVDTDTPRDIDGDEAELRGSVDMNDFRNGEVFFVYGQDEGQVEDIEDDYDEYRDIDEDGDDLQKVLMDSDLDGDENYDLTVRNLDEGEDYYYQICVGYEDDDDDEVIKCGGVEDFEADEGGSSNDDEPEAETDEAENIEEDEAELHGSVDMNDFDDGIVFFVYGEDESQVEDIADDYDEYADIDEDGDDLQKIKIDSSLDGYRTYWQRVVNLDDNTDYYYQICVEYEDEDDDQVLECGGVENFETD